MAPHSPAPPGVGFLVSGLTGSSLLSGYSNWVITHATPDQRPIYAGLFSTIAAVVSLIAPFIGGTIAQQIGYEALFVVALAMVLGALFVTLRYIHRPRTEEAVKMAAAD